MTDQSPTPDSRNPMHRGKDFCTLDQAMNMVLNTCGPLAKAVIELQAQMKVLDARLAVVEPQSPGDQLPPITASSVCAVPIGTLAHIHE